MKTKPFLRIMKTPKGRFDCAVKYCPLLEDARQEVLKEVLTEWKNSILYTPNSKFDRWLEEKQKVKKDD